MADEYKATVRLFINQFVGKFASDTNFDKSTNFGNEIIVEPSGHSNKVDAQATSLFSKRICRLINLRLRMRHNVSSGRGRGRAKSQLRRSGISQKLHRIEQSCYDKTEDRKSDIDSWEELEYGNRSLSESSVDSEDSFCIVFENDYCSLVELDYETDEEESASAKMETESETEDEEIASDNIDVKKHYKKVRFNLTPIVHLMPQWDDACELERWGYWEEKMRDQKRFLDRIRRVNGVLKQVLTEEHRIRIWNDRFAINR